MSEPRHISNDEAKRLFKVSLPAIPMSGVDANQVSEDVRYRSLVVASQLVVWDLLAAGHRRGDGEKNIRTHRAPVRISPDVVRSSAGSPASMCSEFGRGASPAGTYTPASKRQVSLPFVSILAEAK